MVTNTLRPDFGDKDLEYFKFVKHDDEIHVRVLAEAINALPVKDNGSIISGISFDSLSLETPNSITEIYKYYEGGLSGDLKATVTIIYTNSSKNQIVSVVRT